MIKFEKTDVYGFEAAIRGARNPLDSHRRMDSSFVDGVHLGSNDLDLMKRLSKAGNDHAKYLRMIDVTVDITAPIYWWKEADQYKVGTTTNSYSTMHKIHSKPFTIHDFSFEHMTGEQANNLILETIKFLNKERDLFNSETDPFIKKKHWWNMIQGLPSSYNQKRTYHLDYQVLKNMYFARKDHKLDEWKGFCEWCLTLPYFKEICVDVYQTA